MTRSVLLLSLLVVGPAKGAAEEGSVVGGAMRFATEEEAFLGGFAGVTVDVWRVEPYAYVSHDAGVWAIQAGVAVPVVWRPSVRASIRFGTSTAVSGPAVEPTSTRPSVPVCAPGGESACWPKWTARGPSRWRAPGFSSAGDLTRCGKVRICRSPSGRSQTAPFRRD